MGWFPPSIVSRCSTLRKRDRPTACPGCSPSSKLRQSTSNICLAWDQPLFVIAKQVQWIWSQTHGEDLIIVMFGGLRIEMAALKTVGSWLEGSGWDDSIVEAGVATVQTPCLSMHTTHTAPRLCRTTRITHTGPEGVAKGGVCYRTSNGLRKYLVNTNIATVCWRPCI